ncbi:MAG: hypothetical protein KDA96_19025 [Planctomycetaceae bacterium]|nr:hypothetical protein [Planctomycetaceae bacterium]
MIKTISVVAVLASVTLTGVALTRTHSPGSGRCLSSDAAPDGACCLSSVFAEMSGSKSDSSTVGGCQSLGAASKIECAGGACDQEQSSAATCPACAKSAIKAAAVAREETSGCSLCRETECQKECEDCRKASENTAAGAAKKGASQTFGKGHGHGIWKGAEEGHGETGDPRHDQDHQDFFFLVEHREEIQREVTNLDNGIETVTESDNPEVATMIQVHVDSMYDRVENHNPIRMRDPLFREIFANADKITMEVKPTEKGVVRETSEDPYVVKLLQEHAKVVNLFIRNGYPELPRNHAAPVAD